MKRCSKCRELKALDAFNFKNSWCKPCKAEAAKAKRRARGVPERRSYTDDAERKAAARERLRAWKEAHPDRWQAHQARYRAANKAACYQASTRWRLANPDMAWVVKARRRALEKQALPAWADADAIKEVYKLAAQAAELLGQGAVHVDHLVPLNSPYVCGLHVAVNLAVVFREENMSKQNRYWPDMPEIGKAEKKLAEIYAQELAEIC